MRLLSDFGESIFVMSDMFAFVPHLEQCIQEELMVGECWIGMTQAQGSGLILATRLGKDNYFLPKIQ